MSPWGKVVSLLWWRWSTRSLDSVDSVSGSLCSLLSLSESDWRYGRRPISSGRCSSLLPPRYSIFSLLSLTIWGGTSLIQLAPRYRLRREDISNTGAGIISSWLPDKLRVRRWCIVDMDLGRSSSVRRLLVRMRWVKWGSWHTVSGMEVSLKHGSTSSSVTSLSPVISKIQSL